MSIKEERPIDIYNFKVVPKLKEIDTILKSECEISAENACKLLDLDKEELESIINTLKIQEINHKNFFSIMLNGSSFICQLLKREIECGSPSFYNYRHISYIYNLDIELVKGAFKFLGAKTITANQIRAILIQIF